MKLGFTQLWQCQPPSCDGRQVKKWSIRLAISPLSFKIYSSEGYERDTETNFTQVSDEEQNQANSLRCKHCNTLLGSVNEHEVGYRIWKSRVTLLQDPDALTESHDSAIFIAAQLLHLIESSIARKVMVHGNANGGLLCWIFNPDIYYSSSKRGPTVHRAMKVFYKEVQDPLLMLDKHNSTFEELVLPMPELAELKTTLQSSAQVLPQSARTFQDWQVGLLDRYEERPSGQVVMDENALNHPGPREIQLFGRPEGWSELFV